MATIKTGQGFVKVYRSVFDHPVFKSKKLSRRDAWLWLLMRARYEPTIISIGGRPYTLERGEYATSIRNLAREWGWSKDATARFVNILKNHSMITTKTTTVGATGATIISITNYDTYQDKPKKPRQQADDNRDDTRDSDRDKTATSSKKGKEGSNKKKETSGRIFHHERGDYRL